MPYIHQGKRAAIDAEIRDIAEPGDLSYTITQASRRWLYQGNPGNPISYSRLATLVGVLVLTTFEIIMRIVQPYEARKRGENGDVF